MSQELLTAEEVARLLRVQKSTVYSMIKRGEIPSRKIGKQLRVNGDLSGIQNVSFHLRFNAQFHIVGGQFDLFIRRVDENTFQNGHGRPGGDGFHYDAYGTQECLFFK